MSDKVLYSNFKCMQSVPRNNCQTSEVKWLILSKICHTNMGLILNHEGAIAKNGGNTKKSKTILFHYLNS